MTMVQRSSDFATAGCINQAQYVALQIMVAKELGIKPGKFTWKPVNVQIYDRHFDQCIDMLNREPVNCNATIKLKEEAIINWKKHNNLEFINCACRFTEENYEKVETDSKRLEMKNLIIVFIIL